MKKFLLSAPVLFAGILAAGQKVTNRIKLETGQQINATVQMSTKASQEMQGQSIEFNTDDMAYHSYKVTNATDDNITLHHQMNRITFSFDGMGQKKNFDSDKPGDMKGMFGKPIADVLGKSYDAVVSAGGTVMMAQPEKIELAATDERLQVVLRMLQDVLEVAQPPKKGGHMLTILPEHEVGVGDSWTDTTQITDGYTINKYTLAAITDTAYQVTLDGSASKTSSSEIMGMQATSTLNSKLTGTLLVDRNSGITKEKKIDVQTTGSLEIMGNQMPINSKSNLLETLSITN